MGSEIGWNPVLDDIKGYALKTCDFDKQMWLNFNAGCLLIYGFIIREVVSFYIDQHPKYLIASKNYHYIHK